MQKEAEILIDNNELIYSTSIEWIVTVRQNALQQLTSLMQSIAEISRLTQRIGGDIIINDMRLDVRITSS
ncbi:TPA: hypothetical protein J1442_002662 [Escherichia coli]|nr:hypothetical protein [Escherichia coli]EEQ9666363.1 hypothetical protein [Escherichia coli]EEW0063261.1 hypothetical protein [Escherichia coli]EFA1708002.1 hypothetical protein [Escherichia coli]EFC7119744.1 hypothetical protein [Escherichia coli]